MMLKADVSLGKEGVTVSNCVFPSGIRQINSRTINKMERIGNDLRIKIDNISLVQKLILKTKRRYRLLITPFCIEKQVLKLGQFRGVVDKINHNFIITAGIRSRHVLTFRFQWTTQSATGCRTIHGTEFLTPVAVLRQEEIFFTGSKVQGQFKLCRVLTGKFL